MALLPSSCKPAHPPALAEQLHLAVAACQAPSARSGFSTRRKKATIVRGDLKDKLFVDLM